MSAATPRPVRTFGDLKDRVDAGQRCYYFRGLCAFCKQYRDKVFRYSTRHSICEGCAETRRDVVLPKVKRRERLDRRLAAAREVRS